MLELDTKMDDRLQIWTDDITFVLNQLENGEEQLAPLIKINDSNQVGVFGMSLSGAAAGKICVEDSRFKAGVNMDGIQSGHSSID